MHTIIVHDHKMVLFELNQLLFMFWALLDPFSRLIW